jgi:hypothetical protein
MAIEITTRAGNELQEILGDMWGYVRYRGALRNAIKGKRGQAFLKELLEAIEALPEKKLAVGAFRDRDGCASALGALALKRGHSPDELAGFHYMTPDQLARFFGIQPVLIRHIVHMHDVEIPFICAYRHNNITLEIEDDEETRAEAWRDMHNWLNRSIVTQGLRDDKQIKL